MNKFKKSLAAFALVGGSMLWATVAQAVPITGQFSLVNDGSGFFNPGQLLASGTFRTEADARNRTYTLNGVEYATVNIETISLFDQTGGYLPDFLYPSDSETRISRLFAIIDNDNPEAILGLQGVIRNIGSRPNGRVDFYGPQLGYSGAFMEASFTLNGRTVANGRVGESGIQVVPEPSALALLGAGLLAFGFVRRRRQGAV